MKKLCLITVFMLSTFAFSVEKTRPSEPFPTDWSKLLPLERLFIGKAQQFRGDEIANDFSFPLACPSKKVLRTPINPSNPNRYQIYTLTNKGLRCELQFRKGGSPHIVTLENFTSEEKNGTIKWTFADKTTSVKHSISYNKRLKALKIRTLMGGKIHAKADLTCPCYLRIPGLWWMIKRAAFR